MITRNFENKLLKNVGKIILATTIWPKGNEGQRAFPHIVSPYSNLSLDYRLRPSFNLHHIVVTAIYSCFFSFSFFFSHCNNKERKKNRSMNTSHPLKKLRGRKESALDTENASIFTSTLTVRMPLRTSFCPAATPVVCPAIVVFFLACLKPSNRHDV